ncbi:DUF975 family protein [Bacillus sp. 03113]|uniref:DUF975 family protein n=1 Tax=Bacillus sp. 03113 TaxID=2578211 RepID=UPI001144A47E|nr:DUF975 family protein [Bacillus sp. 03113]
MTISEIKKKARTSLSGQWGKAVLLTLLVFLLNTVIPGIFEIPLSGGFQNWIVQEETPASVTIINIIIAIVLIPFSISVSWFFLSLSRLEKPQIGDTFAIYKDGKTSIKVIGTSILAGIFTFLWTLLLIIPGIIKSISYSQAYFLLKDHPEYKVLEAISESKKRMKGYKWKYFLMNLSFIGWGILALLTLGIGFLWLVPYVSASLATFYNELIANRDYQTFDKETI